MKPVILLFCISGIVVQSLFAQIQIPAAVLHSVGSISSRPTEEEISKALKESLQIGVDEGSKRLSTENGFLHNAAIKLLFPPEVRGIEKSLRALGLNQICDDFILALNRSAELAVTEAKPVFLTAIRQMSISDAAGILMSNREDAATSYYRDATSTDLHLKFEPVIRRSLDNTNATKVWETIIARYNKLPLVGKVQTDLGAYATQKALEGLFSELAIEEHKLRSNAGTGHSSLLKKVFAFAQAK